MSDDIQNGVWTRDFRADTPNASGASRHILMPSKQNGHTRAGLLRRSACFNDSVLAVEGEQILGQKTRS